MQPIKDATPRWAFMRRYRVQAGGITYLTRFALIQTPLFGVWLHYIHRKDPGGSPHNHPWNFRSLVLHGGYVEKFWRFPQQGTGFRQAERREHKRWSFKKFSQDWAHSIEYVENDTITLVFVGRHTGSWGFFTWKGFQEWDEAPTLTSNYGYMGDYLDGLDWKKVESYQWVPTRRPMPGPGRQSGKSVALEELDRWRTEYPGLFDQFDTQNYEENL